MSSYTLHIQYVDRPAETRTFTQPKVTLGRDSGDIVLHDTQVSGRHGEIAFDGSTLRYTDVGSTNGSFLLQGQRVANIELTPGIALRLGNSLITVQIIDAPNVAGKGRTVIAGPGMAPGFPAPMRPPAGPAAPVGAIPRPGMPVPAAPPPGGFAFAPTAQMQNPAMPSGMPGGMGMPSGMPGGMSGMPPAPAGAYVPQPATMQAPPSPSLAPPQPATFPPQPATFPPQPAPQTPAPSFSTQPPQAVPGPPPGAPMGAFPGAPPGAAPGMPQAPQVAAPQVMMGIPPMTPQMGGPEVSEPTDLMSFVTGAWEGIKPQIIPATLITAIVSVPMAVLGWFVSVTFGLTGLGGVLLLVLTLAQIAASLIVFPALMRFVLGVHLGQAPDVRAVITEQVADLKAVAPNFLVFGLVAVVAAIFLVVPVVFVAIFLGQIYFVEGKRYIDAVQRNLELAKPDWITVTVNVLVPAIVGSIGVTIVGMILGVLPVVGGLLGLLARAIGQAILMPVIVMLCTRMYFQLRRRAEGGDPEAEARARLGVAALPAA